MQGLNSAALETILKSIPAGVIIIEKENGKIVYVNDRFIELSGFNPNGLSLKKYALEMVKARRLDGEPYLYEQLPLTKALTSGEIIYNQEIAIQKPDESRLIILANAKPLTDIKGKITGAIAIFEDVTELKKAEDELASSERLLSAVTNASSDAIYVKDRESHWLFANPALEHIAGKTSAEVLGKTDAEIYPSPEVGKAILENDRRIMDSGKAETFEETVDFPDGRHFFISVKAPRFDEKGHIIGLIGISHDITQRKKREQALLEAQDKLKNYASNLESLVNERTEKIIEDEQSYRELYDSFGEAFIATDWELNVIHWNNAAERITRVKAKDALGKKVYDVLPEMMEVNITPYFEKLQKKQPTRFMLNTTSRETGKQAVFEISTYPSSKGIIIIVEDKTEEENVKRLSVIGQTAAMVGHDIRNPLQSITNDVYLLKDYLTSMPEMETRRIVAESLDGIEKNVEYINKIVQDLQDYAKPLTTNTKESETERILDDVLIKKAIPENIEVSRKVDLQAKKLITNPDLLKRILANLVNNAVQAMPKGGKLAVYAHRRDNDIIISVEDTGSGIPEDVRPKLFTPLFTTKSKGQGLGLAVVKRMTEALGGSVTFESELGVGTKFILRFPANNS